MGSLSRGLVQPGVTYSGSQPMIMSQAMPQPMQSYQASRSGLNGLCFNAKRGCFSPTSDGDA